MVSPSILPRLIHQMWIPPADAPRPDLPENLCAYAARWAQLNPGHAHRIWRLPEVVTLCRRHGRHDVIDAIGQCRFPSMQADVARLFLLLLRGGIWCDLKLVPLQPIPPALYGFQTVLAEHFPTAARPDPDGLLVNGFIAASPGAPVIATALDLVLRNIDRRQGDGVFAITGPGALTLAYRAHRLGHAHHADHVHVLPHERSWNVLWGVGLDSYNRPGAHWAVRQRTESPFMAPERPVQPAELGLFEAIPGHVVRIDAIWSRQGFHPFEPESGFAWLSDAAPPRLLFDAPLPFNALRLKLYAQPGCRLEEGAFQLNGQTLPGRITPDGDGWAMVDLGPFAVRPVWNALVIHPPPAPPASAADPRRLGLAVAWIQPAII
jgi:hypothetical protein